MEAQAKSSASREHLWRDAELMPQRRVLQQQTPLCHHCVLLRRSTATFQTMELEPQNSQKWPRLPKITIHNIQLKKALWKPPLDPSAHRSLPNISRPLCCPALGHDARQWCLKNMGAGESWQHIQQLPWSHAAWRAWAQQLLSQKHCRILLLENVSDTKR